MDLPGPVALGGPMVGQRLKEFRREKGRWRRTRQVAGRKGRRAGKRSRMKREGGKGKAEQFT